MSETRGLLQAILDSLAKDKVNVVPPKKKELSEAGARKKAEGDAWASLDEPAE